MFVLQGTHASQSACFMVFLKSNVFKVGALVIPDCVFPASKVLFVRRGTICYMLSLQFGVLAPLWKKPLCSQPTERRLSVTSERLDGRARLRSLSDVVDRYCGLYGLMAEPRRCFSRAAVLLSVGLSVLPLSAGFLSAP